MDRVPGYEPGGRRFESFRARHSIINAMKFNTAKILLAIFLISSTSFSLLWADEQSSRIYAAQLRQMIAEQNAVIKMYTERLSDEKISDSDLLALAEAMVDSLAHWITSDLPFLVAERHHRIANLRNMLSSPEADVVEKMRRIFEAYRIEAEYGFTFENYRAKLGDDNAKIVDFVHIGRNILIYRTLDGHQRSVWDRYAKNWQPLKSNDDYAIKRALNIARKLAKPEILRLPVQFMQRATTESISTTKDSRAARLPNQVSVPSTKLMPVSQALDLDQEVVALEKLLAANKQQIVELQSLYHQKLGSSKELITVIHNSAVELQMMISESFMPLLLPHYRATLEPLLQNHQTLQIEQIKALHGLFIELYQAQAETGFFATELILADGTPARRKVAHIGPFTLLYENKLLYYERSIQHAVVLPKFPNKIFPLFTDDITTQLTDSFVKVPLDLSQGTLLTVANASLTIIDRIQQGGWISYIILFLGAYALLLVLCKIFLSWKCLRMVRRQKYKTDYDNNNPLGRVLDSGSHATANIESLEWAIEQAVQKEIPQLEWGFSTIKVLIVAAPLLGLLGTVFGMIETFEAINLFASNNPQIIAQGISMALTTTMLGLCVAIPLLLLYTWAMSYSKEIRNILEEQSAGLLMQQSNKLRQ